MYLHVPAVLQRFTRFASDLDDDMKTACDRVVVQSARACRGGGSRKRYTRVETARRHREVPK